MIVYFGGNNSVLYDPNVPSSHVPLDEYVENMRKIAIHLKVNFIGFYFLVKIVYMEM